MEDIIEISRRQDGPGVWENFEYLALLAKKFAETHTSGAYPKNTPLMPLLDRWLLEDRESGA